MYEISRVEINFVNIIQKGFNDWNLSNQSKKTIQGDGVLRLDVFLLVLNATKKPWNLKFQGFLINWWVVLLAIRYLQNEVTLKY